MSLFFYQTDFSYFVFGTFFIINFLLFFILMISDKKSFNYYLNQTSNDQFLKNQNSFGSVVSYSLIKVHIDLLLLSIFSNIFVFFCVFLFTGPCVFNIIVSEFSIDINSLYSILCVNFFLVFYILCFRERKKKSINQISVNSKFFFQIEELLIFYFIHFLSFFIFSCSNFIGIFILVELLTFSYFILLSISTTRKSILFNLKASLQARLAEASLCYLIPNLFSSIFLLFGVFFFYFTFGTLNVAEIFLFLKYFSIMQIDPLFVIIGLFFIFISFCIKLSIAPFHNWIILVYKGCSQHLVFFLSTFSKFFYFLIFLKIFFPFFLFFPVFYKLFLIVGLISLYIATLNGIFEKNFNALVGYSGILNVGYSFFCLALLQNYQILQYAFYAFFVYVLFSVLFFLCIIKAQNHLNFGSVVKTISDVSKLAELDNSVGFILSLILFAIIGIPPLPGFYPKFQMCMALFFSCSSVFMGFLFFVVFFIFVIFSAFFYIRIIGFSGLTFTALFSKFTNVFNFVNFSNTLTFKIVLIFVFFFSIPIFVEYLSFFIFFLVCFPF